MALATRIQTRKTRWQHPARCQHVQCVFFSKWMLPCIFVVRSSDNEIFASLGNSVRGALAWPVATINAELFALSDGPVTWLHVADPRDWSVMSWTARRRPLHGAVLQGNGHNISLIKYTLSQKKHGLHADDFAKCVTFLGLRPDGDSPKALLTSLAGYASPGDN
eukprot:8397869-Pyramimonas_sp.AAC.1